MDKKLKPCPFCGNKAHLKITGDHEGFIMYVECRICFARSSFVGLDCENFEDVRLEAIEYWNTRK